MTFKGRMHAPTSSVTKRKYTRAGPRHIVDCRSSCRTILRKLGSRCVMSAGMLAPRQHQCINRALGADRRLGYAVPNLRTAIPLAVSSNTSGLVGFGRKMIACYAADGITSQQISFCLFYFVLI